jgi:hypothetical protein
LLRKPGPGRAGNFFGFFVFLQLFSASIFSFEKIFHFFYFKNDERESGKIKKKSTADHCHKTRQFREVPAPLLIVWPTPDESLFRRTPSENGLQHPSKPSK